ncbi:hypothetical protein GCM10023339_20360 [Alloalcanivorax gelatiniphagus]
MDGEGCFYIEQVGNYFKFCFKITLHKDDYKVLISIRENLGFGRIFLKEKTAVYITTSMEDMSKFI